MTRLIALFLLALALPARAQMSVPDLAPNFCEIDNRSNPLKASEANLRRGVAVFNDHCALCHENPRKMDVTSIPDAALYAGIADTYHRDVPKTSDFSQDLSSDHIWWLILALRE